MAWRKSQNGNNEKPEVIQKDVYSEVVYVRRNFELKSMEDMDGTTREYWEYEENKIPFSEYETFCELQDALETSNNAQEGIVELAEHQVANADAVEELREAIIELASSTGGN